MKDFTTIEKSNFVQLKNDWRKYYVNKLRREMTPPIFFHEKAIKFCEREDFLYENHIEYIYATLVSWGMHRAGGKGAKMPSFEVFKQSILRNKACIEQLKNYRIETILEDKLNEILPCLTCLCFNIQATTCSSKIVSSSKTLAHILPNLVCPIDNLYTLSFFKEGFKKEKIKTEQQKFQYIIKQMWNFYHTSDFISMKINLNETFAHSYPKIFDNLIMEYVRQKNNYNN